MDIDVIRAKQDGIARCITRIQSKAHLSYEELLEDYDAQDVITLNLERAVQQACDIAAMILADTAVTPSDTMRGAFRALNRLTLLSDTTTERMTKAVGFRNIAVHTYHEIDWEVVYSIIPHARRGHNARITGNCINIANSHLIAKGRISF